MIELNIKCPNCGHNVTLDDGWNDTEFFDDEYRDYSTCTCENCDKSFYLTLIYKFSHFELGEEIED